MKTKTRFFQLLTSVAVLAAGPVLAMEHLKGIHAETPGGDFSTTIHGYIHASYHNFQEDATALPSNTFFVSERGIIKADSTIVQRGRLVLEVQTTKETQKISLLQSYGEWTFHPTFRFGFGRFLMPFGLQDSLYYAPNRLANDAPWAHTEVIPDAWNEVGARAGGSFDLFAPRTLRYDLVISNGLRSPDPKSEDAIQLIDDNNNKLIGGRVTLHPLSGANMGVSYASEGFDSFAHEKLTFRGYHFTMDRGPLTVRGEYISSSFRDGENVFRYSYYAGAAYKLLENEGIAYLQPFFTYERKDPNTRIDTMGDQRRFLVGLKLAPTSLVKFTAEYQKVNGISMPDRRNNGAILSAIFQF